ncbi:exodeoxyribonuclease VII large subunit [Rubricella aquisinus]|uniref:Exodeoxyribonuclease 7 large subunit n=1 Tax=Rubricella aquisinus TaxID=2028108 RepID=A0A840WYG9_9RHOB|nr:exodeoxyribonuclease VII large subunit [Rubricella aquisinus]MBB5516200.1 exodeoxyribonuclease VII large subunit [Rubricella aquisinus]
MSDLIDDDIPGRNAPEFSVSDLSGAVKRLVEGNFSHVRVRGEVGRVSRPRSGHVYLDLKDDRSVIAGVIWKGVASRLRTPPEEGMEVVVTGRLTTFPGQSKYQIVIESLAPAGVGALMAMLEKRRMALAAEGLFDAERKRPLPRLPRVIGVVTSPSGAVIRDILHRLRDRFPREVIVWPVAVQGERCAPEVAAALRGFNALPAGGAVPRPDVLIVARGGGSLEDLWGFNEEIVVRAVAESDIPVISAVGHETDTTLVDFAADRRAPTPTAAAEFAVPVRADLLATLASFDERRQAALARLLQRQGERLRTTARVLPRPEVLLAERAQRLDIAAARLPLALRDHARAKRGLLQERGGSRLSPALLTGLIRHRRQQVTGLAQWIRPERAMAALTPEREALARLARRLEEARDITHTRRTALTALDRVMRAAGYQQTLARGYVVVRDAEGGVVTDGGALNTGQGLELEFRQETRVGVTVGDTAQPAKAKPRKSAPKSGPDGQGSLF